MHRGQEEREIDDVHAVREETGVDQLVGRRPADGRRDLDREPEHVEEPAEPDE
jgi:hypothetical protein